MLHTSAQLYKVFRQHKTICTDSRKIVADSLFFALKGDNFDGNQYAEAALANGAAYAIVDDPEVAKNDQYLLVEDVLKSLQDLAGYHRQQLDIPVLAITGSNGKTTTKELVAGVLAERFRTHYTQGNFNNHIGLPLTLLSMPEDTELAVIEMGANHQGEIAALCEIATPTHGLITNIGQAHLEGFGGIEGVKKGKSELYVYLSNHGGTAFVNEDAEFLAGLLPPAAKKISYRSATTIKSEQTAVLMEIMRIQPDIEVHYAAEGKTWPIQSTMMGQHNVENIKTAIAVGHYFGVSPERIATAIAAYQPKNNRSQRIQWQSHEVYLDAYNANPSSMRAALTAYLAEVKVPPVLVLGDMLELGKDSVALHQELIDWLAAASWSMLLVVGSQFEQVRLPARAHHFADVKALKSWWETQAPADVPVFIKGSRGIALERLLMD